VERVVKREGDGDSERDGKRKRVSKGENRDRAIEGGERMGDAERKKEGGRK